MKYVFLFLFSFSLWGADAPPLLKDWDIFNLKKDVFKFNEENLHYDLNTTLFTDYAQKFRTIRIPEGTKIKKIKDEFIYPDGTVISKTFFYDRDELNQELGLTGPWGRDKFLVETRILHKNEGKWSNYVYVWDMETKSAHYEPYGKQYEFTHKTKGSFNYFVPDKNQCMSCHISFKNYEKTIKPLGPSFIPNFNHKDQLVALKKRGWLEEMDLSDTKPLPVWNDPHSGDLESRAKAYLHVNCAHCHSKIGPAANTGLYLEYKRGNTRKRGLCKSPVAPGIGSGGRPYAISPGKPEDSILTFRIRSRKLAIMMPEIGRDLAHKEGIDVVSKWISSLKETCP